MILYFNYYELMLNYRQGDVLLSSSNLPSKAVPESTLIVAEGEATGHHHKLCGSTALIYTVENDRYIVAKEPTILEHQEHKSITIPEGTYKIKIQRELDLMNQVRNVFD